MKAAIIILAMLAVTVLHMAGVLDWLLSETKITNGVYLIILMLFLYIKWQSLKIDALCNDVETAWQESLKARETANWSKLYILERIHNKSKDTK